LQAAKVGFGGTGGGGGASCVALLDAIDYQTGKVKRRDELTNGSVGVTSTAGSVIFMSNGGVIEAIQATDGRPLWYSCGMASSICRPTRAPGCMCLS
jgi:hypothetical protein